MSSPGTALAHIDLTGQLKHLASGKVREVYEIDDESLLFVASDRISAYDVILKNGIPEKGAVLTAMSQFWFAHLTSAIPSLQTHLISRDVPEALSSLEPDLLSAISRRIMQVKRLKPFALESIVRGYITGSAWSEYKTNGTVHGIQMKEGLREGDRLPKPIWTPSTKAEVGDKDMNLHPDSAKDIVGAEYAQSIEEASLQLYEKAHEYALTRGIIIADTKFEFAPALDSSASNPSVVLIDEVLTPDSSRFWPLEGYTPGGPQSSFDKQYLRDWLTSNGLKGKEGVEIPEDVVMKTKEKYEEVYEKIVGGQ